MTYKEALEFMCKRCTNYDVCQGTGCHPKNLLDYLIECRGNILTKLP